MTDLSSLTTGTQVTCTPTGSDHPLTLTLATAAAGMGQGRAWMRGTDSSGAPRTVLAALTDITITAARPPERCRTGVM